MEANVSNTPTILEKLDVLLAHFSLSKKAIYAIKVALSVTLAYLVAFSQGWDHASTGAIAIMVIAAGNTLGDSMFKGFLRIVGTAIGAFFGIALIAWMPQDRELYLLLLSLLVTFFIYLGRAYQGDKTIFLLTAMTMMMVFDNGNVDDVFLYGINRTFMTIFGVVVYMLVGVYLWPDKKEEKIDEEIDTGIPEGPKFLFLDPENFKGALVTFLVFWTTTLIWILFNPPGGFYLVTLATSLSLYTAFSPLKPSLLIIVFSFAFVFTTFAYIFVVPNIHHGYELALFLFIYVFFAFYVFKPQLALFFALGLAIMNIQNTMYYQFAIFLNILFLFYAFLFILLLFYYIPFSTRPHDMLVTTIERFFGMIDRLRQPTKSFLKRALANETAKLLVPTAKKIGIWASQTDAEWFGTDREKLMAFAKECLVTAKKIEKAGKGEISKEEAERALEHCTKTEVSLGLRTIHENGRF
ncbi:FUSC family protein [Hydrogenimonas sp.]|uniref:FUSC family protein n=1 Tax=Hydrogenimonas sp. TaxID=2231112 RepID=UPI002627466D|nr:FUSC family protein [Hydrogenimonas sp.]